MNAQELAARLGGKKSGRQYVARCPAHPDSKPSLMIFDGHKAIQLRCLSGCEPRQVISALCKLGLWNGGTIDDESDEAYQARMEERRRREAIERGKRIRQALNVWHDARPAAGTIVERVYLSYWRGLDRARINHLFTDVIRFHDSCPCDNDRRPAMVALMRGIADNRPQAVHRTFLDPMGRKLGVPMMLGPAGGAAIKLVTGTTGILYLAEGIETALAFMITHMTARSRSHSIWAAGSSGAIQRFPVVKGIRELHVCQDNDLAGRKATAAVIERWFRARCSAFNEQPPNPGEDFADALRA